MTTFFYLFYCFRIGFSYNRYLFLWVYAELILIDMCITPKICFPSIILKLFLE